MPSRVDQQTGRQSRATPESSTKATKTWLGPPNGRGPPDDCKQTSREGTLYSHRPESAPQPPTTPSTGKVVDRVAKMTERDPEINERWGPQWDAEYNSHQASSIKWRKKPDHRTITPVKPLIAQPNSLPTDPQRGTRTILPQSVVEVWLFLAIPTVQIKEEKACISILKIVESIKFIITGTWIGTHTHIHVN